MFIQSCGVGLVACALSFAALALGAEPPAKKEGSPLTPQASPSPASKRDDSAAEKLGWHLGTQAWTFRDRTAFEAVDVAAGLGLKYIEFYPGQSLSKQKPEAKVGPEMSAEDRAALVTHAADAGVKVNSFGVVTIKNDEASARKFFEFVRAIGAQTMSCEPEKDAWDLSARLADEYKMNLAIHDHPKPSFYWNPDTVLEAVKGRTARMGACADTGHWVRSGLVPVECLKKLRGRVIELHFKDIADDKDRPWGTGKGDAKGMLEELHAQGFKGVILVEYEDGSGKELEGNVANCIEWFDRAAGAIVNGGGAH